MIGTDQIRALVPAARRMTAGLPEELLNQRPAESSWCLNECFAHVSTLNREYGSRLAEAIRQAKTAGVTGNGPFRLRWLERKFVQLVEPPYRLKVKAPAVFLPPANLDSESVLAEWESTHSGLIDLAAACEGLDLSKVRLPSPASRLFRVSLLGAFEIVCAHSRRHLWQAGRILQKIERA